MDHSAIHGVHGQLFLISIDNQVYAVKRLKTYSETRRNAAIREIETLRNVNHPHIIKYHSCGFSSDYVDIIMEYAPGGDLQSLIALSLARHALISEKDIWKYAGEILSALAYLHDRSLVHGDLKCANVLLTAENHVKLADLGACGAVDQVQSLGTPTYHSPEQVLKQALDCKVDIWALGCLLYNLAAMEHPFKGDNLAKIQQAILRKTPNPLPRRYSQRLSSFISLLLSKPAILRPSAALALTHIPQSYIST
jgi:NIMA (never in mitosis gene a)-related kinase